jgi:hypothetical protein
VGREKPFARPVEAELASIVDDLGIAWEDEPHTFVLARRPDGSIAEAFAAARTRLAPDYPLVTPDHPKVQ